MFGTVLVVDDHPLMLSGLRILIGSLGVGIHIETCFSAETGYAKAQKIPDLKLIILDFALPVLSGVPAVEMFTRNFPAVPLIVLSGSEDKKTEACVISAGAMAYVSKSAKPEILLDLIRCAIHNTSGKIHSRQGSSPGKSEAKELPLTARQKQVLKLLMQGRSNKEIAIQLDVAEITVKTHIASLMRRLGATNRTQVVIEAQRCGILPREDSSSTTHDISNDLASH